MPETLTASAFARWLLTMPGGWHVGRSMAAMDCPISVWLQATRSGAGYVATGVDAVWINYQFGRTVQHPLDRTLRAFVRLLDCGGDRAVTADAARAALALVWRDERDEVAA